MASVHKSLIISGYQMLAVVKENFGFVMDGSAPAGKYKYYVSGIGGSIETPSFVIKDLNKNPAAWRALCAGGFEMVIVEGQEDGEEDVVSGILLVDVECT